MISQWDVAFEHVTKLLQDDESVLDAEETDDEKRLMCSLDAALLETGE